MRTLVAATLVVCLAARPMGLAWSQAEPKATAPEEIAATKRAAACKLVDGLFMSMLPPIRNKQVTRATADALRKMGEEAAAPLARKLREGMAFPAFAREAAAILGDIGPDAIDAVPTLTAVVKPASAACQEAREAAMEALGKILKGSFVLNDPEEATLLGKHLNNLEYRRQGLDLALGLLARDSAEALQAADRRLERAIKAEDELRDFVEDWRTRLGDTAPRNNRRADTQARLDRKGKIEAQMTAVQSAANLALTFKRPPRDLWTQVLGSLLYAVTPPQLLQAVKLTATLPVFQHAQGPAQQMMNMIDEAVDYVMTRVATRNKKEIIKKTLIEMKVLASLFADFHATTGPQQVQAVNTITASLDDPCFAIRVLAAEALALIYR